VSGRQLNFPFCVDVGRFVKVSVHAEPEGIEGRSCHGGRYLDTFLPFIDWIDLRFIFLGVTKLKERTVNEQLKTELI